MSTTESTADPATVATFQIDRDDYTNHRVVQADRPDLNGGEVRVRIDAFAFTANNMTYAVAGDVLRYWEFFPATADEAGNWGVIPVWGFADVIESRCAEVPEGDRLYGYFPPAQELVMQPIRVSAGSLIDGIPHRQALPPLYNRYRRVGAEERDDSTLDDATMLLGPLHLTSYVLGHRLESRDFHDAEQVVIISASSKTSLGLAFALSGLPDTPSVVGVTSSRNAEFVEATDLYDQVVAYDDLDEVLPKRRSVVVDMAGNASVAATLRERLGSDLAFTILVGITHWEETSAAVTGARPDPALQENFFAPSYILKIVEALGPREFDQRSTAFLRDAAAATFGWMSVDRRDGLAGLTDVFPDVRDGAVSPAVGIVVEM